MARILSILLIEDDTIEKMKVDRTLQSLGLHHRVIQANHGEEALERLTSSSELPDIVLLDLNMPKMNGIEFLRELKNNEQLRYLPVIVITTSSNYKDLQQCYEIGIAGYITKPLKYDHYVKKLQVVLEYWSINELVRL